MGKVIGLTLADAGVDVAISYRTKAAEARKVVKAIQETGHRSFAVRADLAKAEDARRVVETAAAEFGRLDILVNNVGEWVLRSVEDTDLRTWRRIVDSNLTATYVCSRAAVRHMRRNRWGRIVSLGAAGAYRAHGSAKMSAFYAAKAGIVAFSKSLAREVGEDGITVNVVSPGVIEDPELSVEAARQLKAKDTVVGRPGTGSDVAAAVLFLVSEEAAFITGDVIGVTGGWLL